MSNMILTEEMMLRKSKAFDLKDIKKMNLWASDLTDISVLRNAVNVEVLTLSVNNISSLKELEGCINLCELYMRNNKISDLNQLYYLKDLKKLKILWLADNPCALEDNYRLKVLKVLPDLSKLDNAPVTRDEVECAKQLDFEVKCPDNEGTTSNNAKDELLLTKTEIYLELKAQDEQKDEENELNNSENDIVENEDSDCLNKTTELNGRGYETSRVDANNGITQNGNHQNENYLSTATDNNFLDTVASVDNNSTVGELGLGFADQQSPQKNVRLSFDETNKLRAELGLKPLEQNPIKQLNFIKPQSVNVLTAVLALVKDLNLDGLEMVISACEYRKKVLKSEEVIEV